MQKDLPVIYKARVVVQSETPLMLASGRESGIFDVEIVRDANGLPTLPGTAIAGVLRHLCADVYGDAARVNEWFGYQDRDEGQTSRVHCSFGVVHNCKNEPVEGLLLAPLEGDKILECLAQAQPLWRDHVSLTDRGVAKDTAKFDRTVTPTGTRFTFELSFHCAQVCDADWQQLLNLLAHPRFRLGGATRAGYGAFSVVQVQQGCFDLRTPAGRKAFINVPKSLAKPTAELKTLFLKNTFDKGVGVTLTLNAEDAWRIGSGSTAYVSSDKDADALILSERKIAWDKNAGSIQEHQWVVPGAGVKGAIAHRVLYHWHRLSQHYAEDVAVDGVLPPVRRNTLGEEVTELLGDVREGENDQQAFARAGVLYFKDCYPVTQPNKVSQRMHNSLDRFTGGTRHGVLFCEEVIEGGTLNLHIFIDTPNATQVSTTTRRALHAALEDLCEGRLGLGAGSGKGLGYFTGSMTWSDAGAWIKGEQA